MKISPQDLEILTNLMIEYSKENWFPFYEKILEFSPVNKAIFSAFSREEYYKNLVKQYVLRKIDSLENTKMWKLFKTKYLKNSKLFYSFVLLNLDKNFSDEFHKIWEQVKKELNLIEEELFKSIEQSQYKDFSNWLYKKYEKMIKSYFPYINNVGVIVRTAK